MNAPALDNPRLRGRVRFSEQIEDECGMVRTYLALQLKCPVCLTEWVLLKKGDSPTDRRISELCGRCWTKKRQRKQRKDRDWRQRRGHRGGSRVPPAAERPEPREATCRALTLITERNNSPKNQEQNHGTDHA
jgi:hypothetical protein